MSDIWNGVKIADLTAPTPEQARDLFGMVTMAEFAEGMQRLSATIRSAYGVPLPRDLTGRAPVRS